MAAHSILIIDDDEQLSDILCVVLEAEGYSVTTCARAEQAFSAMERTRFSVALLDLKLGATNGLDLLPRLRELAPSMPFLVITAHGDVDSAVRAFGLGARGYIKKPFQEGDLKDQITRAIGSAPLGAQAGDPARRLILSRDSAMEPVFRSIARASQVSSNVIITGESGSGKELVARALHQSGSRRDGPFVAFNCAAVPESLIESELFGYTRGAFTDARESKPGLFARAHGGTLFIDEIGDASLAIQAKLLRVLQEREITPIGGLRAVSVDVRVIAATHRSLQEEVEHGRFRQDLFYRLHVLPIHVPPLRNRPKDILPLASHFARAMASEMGIAFKGYTPEAESALESHPWPGNVRELKNRIERALALGGIADSLTARCIFPEVPASPPPEPERIALVGGGMAQLLPMPCFRDAKIAFERQYLERLFAATRGNVAKAARIAEKSRAELYGMIRKHGLDPVSYKG